MSKAMIGGDREDDEGYDSDDISDDQEMVSLVKRDDENNDNRPNEDGATGQSKKASRLRPLMILQRPRFAFGGGDGHRRDYRRYDEDDAGASAHRCGILWLSLAVLCGVWWWVSSEEAYRSRAEGPIGSNRNDPFRQYHKLRVKDIRRWCLDGRSDTCECDNPLEPMDRIGHKSWGFAHDGNVRDAYEAGDAVDVVLYGDSIAEGWRGMSFGVPSQRKHDNLAVFNEFFSVDHGADFEGLALGIAGDKSPHLLWRLQNGELPESLQPSVIWVAIGTNDFLREDYCSADVVLMGIKRVVEEIRAARPSAIVVVNSVLPRSTDGLGGRLVDPKHPKRKTVWSGIAEVNKGLKAYCQPQRNMYYFDATDVFVRRQGKVVGPTGQYIPEELMSDYLHPTAQGYRLWGEQIVRTLHEIMEASKAEQGRKPLPFWFGVKKPKRGQTDLN